MSGTPGATAAATHIPTVAIFAEPSSCNDNGSGVPIFQALAGPHYGLRVTGATHCDPENPSDSLCANFCGGAATPARQAEFSRYATAFLLAYLTCDAESLPYVDGASAAADSAVVRLTETTALAPCAPASDAGIDSGTTDASGGPGGAGGTAGSAGTAGNGGSAGTGGPAASGGEGCGCSIGQAAGVMPLAPGAISMVAMLLACALRQRRRSRRPKFG